MTFISEPRCGRCASAWAALALSAITSLAFAGGGSTREWASGTNGFFHDDFNWTPSFVPGALDEANIGRDGTFTVSFGRNAATDRLRVNAGTVTLDLGGNSYSLLRNTLLSSSTPSLLIGSAGAAPPELTVRNGELSLFSAIIGESTGRFGRLIASGPDSTITMQNNLFLGFSGIGSLRAELGANITTANAFIGTLGAPGSDNLSTADIFAGAQWNVANDLVVGQFGADGRLLSAAGAKVTAGRLLVGRSAGSRGSVFALAGDIHVTGNARLGGGGDAELMVTEAGVVTVAGELSYDRRSSIEVNRGTLDVGSIVRRDDALDFGPIHLNSGTIIVRGDASSYDLGLNSIGFFSTVQIDDALDLDARQSLSVLVDGTLRADSLTGNGAFSVNGGRLELGELILGVAPGQRTSLTLGNPHAPAGFTQTMTVERVSQIQAGAALTLARTNATFDGTLLNSGTLTLINSDAKFNGVGIFGLDGLVNDADLTIINSTIGGEVIITQNASVSIGGDTVFNGRVRTEVDLVAAANSEGIGSVRFNGGLGFDFGAITETHQVTIDSDVSFGDGNTITFAIGGTNSGEFDTLDVTGLLILNGAIEITALDTYTPSGGDVFQLFTADSITGIFTTVTAPVLSNGLYWDITDINSGTIRVVVPAPGAAGLFGLVAIVSASRRRRG